MKFGNFGDRRYVCGEIDLRMPRLPERYITRWIYAAVAGFAGLGTATLTILAFHFDSTLPMSVTDVSYGLMGVPAALLCWPSKPRRTVKRMIFAGLLTVLTSFLLLGLLLAVNEIFMRSDNTPLLRELAELPLDMAAFAVLVSIITLGIPYVIGAFTSVLFAE